MKQIKLHGLDQVLYHDTLLNGLDVYLLPYEDKNNYYISYATKYGSDVTNFISESGEHKVPLGVAHYLEHKMFEEPSGMDPFTFFSKSGSDGNASTSYDYTQYICVGNKNFDENLRYLLQFVNTPYFTDENVEKEKGIISEEIKMYDDLPEYKLEALLRENVYHVSSKKYDIAGTIPEIKKITKEDLYHCYEAFYIPNNMFVLITGKFDPELAFHIIEEELGGKDSKPLPKILFESEPKIVVKKEETIQDNVEIPKIGVAIKIPKKTITLDGLECDLYLSMLTTMLFGSSSEFRERVRQDKILNDIYTEWEDDTDYKTFYLLASSTEPDQLFSEIQYELNHISVVKKTFERIKKVWIANEVKMIDHIDKTQHNFFDDIIRYGTIIDNRIEVIRKMNVKTLESMLKQIDLSEISNIKMIERN